MNLLFFLHRYPNYGGTEKVTTCICNELDSRGHNIHLASLFQKSWELMDELHSSIEFHKLSYPVLSISNVKEIRNILRKDKIDVIVNQWCLPFKTTFLLKVASIGFKVKVISVLHGSPDVNMRIIGLKRSYDKSAILLKPLYKNLIWATNVFTALNLRLTYDFCDKYILLSDRFSETFKKMCMLCKAPKLTSITNPLTIKNTFSEDLLLQQKKNEILYVGRMDLLNKNVDRIILVWKDLYKRFPDWKLVLVGDGPDRNYLEKLAKENGIENIDFMGFLKEEPIEFYKRASILMLTSDLEGFGLVITEAISYGCVPVVYASYPAVYDIIEDGISGFITPAPYDAEITKQRVVNLIENNDMRKSMSANAIRRSDYFSVSNIADKWEILLKGVLNNP